MIKGFRLLTGEILLANIIVEEGLNFEVKNVVFLTQREREDKSIGIVYNRYIPIAIGTQRLMKTAICSVFDVDAEFIAEYDLFFNTNSIIS